MQNHTATLYCPNPLCQAPNPESHHFCQQCRTPLPKRYLWAAGKTLASYRPGDLIGDRYLLKQQQVVLDTLPGTALQSPDTIPDEVAAYLRLVAYRPHIPQVYTLLTADRKRSSEILLLEQAPIYPDGTAEAGTLMPTLVSLWARSDALRQLNWLWQIAQLWEPMAREGVASSLLQPQYLCAEGALVRLVELRPDPTEVGLAELGQLWQQWQPHPAIAAFFSQLCRHLLQGQIRTADHLVMVLDQALSQCGSSFTRQIQIATLTDQGPTRQRNEDACHPPSGTVVVTTPSHDAAGSSPSTTLPLVVVCDGIGGHEGGSVASTLAIATLQEQLQSLLLPAAPLQPTMLVRAMEQAILAANDVISHRNDNEQRQERQRMGTTLVNALCQTHELYLAHVGDSRAYRITRTGCHQVTLDDDLAAREVRLGYTLYREALQQPSSGSLIQALGMNDSSLLHPTIRRFILDEDCLFLLCSDGLSDNDRVEEYWQTELLPVLEGTVDIATASQRLVAIANQCNGHDNVTVGLLYCRVMPSQRPIPSVATGMATLDEPPAIPAEAPPTRPASTLKTQILPPPRSPLGSVVALLSLLLLGGVGLLTYLFLFQPETVRLPTPLSNQPSQPDPIAETPTPNPLPSVGTLMQLNRPSSEPEPPFTQLYDQPVGSASAPIPIPAGSILKIEERRVFPDQNTWLKLRVCSLPLEPPRPSTNEVAQNAVVPVEPGRIGWAKEADIMPLVTMNLSLTASQRGQCPPSTSLSPPAAQPSTQPNPQPTSSAAPKPATN